MSDDTTRAPDAHARPHAPAPQEPADGPVLPIAFETTLTRADLVRVSVATTLLSPLGLTAVAGGPALWAFGALSNASALVSLGSGLTVIGATVPVAAAFAAAYAAWRPGAAELLDTVAWRFADDGVHIGSEGRWALAAWDTFAGWRTVAGCHLLYTDRARYLILPLSGVPVADRADLAALLARSLPRRG